ncbi:MAG: hypothetical protein WBD04_06045 [Candidatus Omnitrophota bacterium]
MNNQNELEKTDESLADLHEEEEVKWYYRPWVIAAAILFFGPLGLIPLWFRPKTKLYVKISISIAVIALTAWMMQTTVSVYKTLVEYYKELGDLM